MPSKLVDRVDIEVLAYRLYRENQPYEKMIWRLAELCEIIKGSIRDTKFFNEDAVDPLGTAETLRNKDIKLEIKIPDEAVVREAAEALHQQHPARAELHWYIAEKTLLLKKLLELYGNGTEYPDIVKYS